MLACCGQYWLKREWGLPQGHEFSPHFLASFLVIILQQLHLCGPLYLALSRFLGVTLPIYTTIWSSITPRWGPFTPVRPPPVGRYGVAWAGCGCGISAMQAACSLLCLKMITKTWLTGLSSNIPSTLKKARNIGMPENTIIETVSRWVHL